MEESHLGRKEEREEHSNEMGGEKDEKKGTAIRMN